MQLIAKTYEGLENQLYEEVIGLGASNVIKSKRAVIYNGDQKLVYESNLKLRTALRILVNINSFKAVNQDELYNKAKKIDWKSFMSVNQSFSIDTVVKSTYFTHSKFVAYKVKDAIVDYFKEKYNRRPNVNTISGDVKFNVKVNEDFVEISLDSSGDSLHLRGYKVDDHAAPLSEVLAAGILLNTDFKSFKSVYDPMCGSGTILTEGFMVDCNIAPNIYREHFGFMNWLDFDRPLWDSIKRNSNNNTQAPTLQYFGTDISRKAVFSTMKNISVFGNNQAFNISAADFLKSKPIVSEGCLIFNPPYDIRLQSDDINSLYKEIGDKLKHDFKNSVAWIFSANTEALKNIGLKPKVKIKLMNGKLPAELRKYELY